MTTQKYPRYKPSNIPWLGEVPAHWEVKKLKYVAIIKYGLGQPPRQKDDGLPLIRATNVERGKINEHDLVFVDPDDVPYDRDPVLKENDIIVVRSGAYTADSAIIPKKFEGAITGYDMVVRVEEDSPHFVAYCLLSNYILVNQLYLNRLRAAQPHLNKEELGETLLMIPPLPEQTAIAHYLDTKTAQIDRLIAAKQQLLALLREERAALINRAVTRGLNPDAKMKDSGVVWLGEVPDGWEVKKLKYIFDCFDSIRVPLNANERGVMEKNYDYYGASGVIDKVENFLFDGDYILIGEDGANLLTRSTALAFKASGKFWVNNHAHIIRPKNGDIDYFVNSLESLDYSIWVSGSAQPKLTSENLLNIALCEPSLREQRDIAKFIGEIDLKVNHTAKKITAEIVLLQEYRTALISEVVTGKIKITES